MTTPDTPDHEADRIQAAIFNFENMAKRRRERAKMLRAEGSECEANMSDAVAAQDELAVIALRALLAPATEANVPAPMLGDRHLAVPSNEGAGSSGVGATPPAEANGAVAFLRRTATRYPNSRTITGPSIVSTGWLSEAEIAKARVEGRMFVDEETALGFVLVVPEDAFPLIAPAPPTAELRGIVARAANMLAQDRLCDCSRCVEERLKLAADLSAYCDRIEKGE